MHELDQVYLEGMIPWNRIRKEIDNFRNLETWYYFEQCKHYGRQKAKRKRLIYGRLQVTYDHQPYQDWCCHTWAGAPVGINLSDLHYHPPVMVWNEIPCWRCADWRLVSIGQPSPVTGGCLSLFGMSCSNITSRIDCPVDTKTIRLCVQRIKQ